MSVKNMMPLLKSELKEGLYKIEIVAQMLQVDPKLVLEEWLKTMNEEPALIPLHDFESKKKFLDLAQQDTKKYWTSEEDAELVQLVVQHGSEWSLIALSFPSRSRESIKSHYNKTLSKKR